MPEKVRRQRPVKGGRMALPSCVEKKLFMAAEREARKYGVSRSFVMAVALGDALGVDLFEDYKEPRKHQG